MTHTVKLVSALAGAVFALGAAPVADALPKQDTFEVEFQFDRRAPAAETYEAFRREARTACYKEDRSVLLRAYLKLQPACISDLVDQAVAKAAIPELSALHAASTDGSAPRTSDLASR